MSLTDAERSILIATEAAASSVAGQMLLPLALHMADEYRLALPDLDDVTISRVLIQVCGKLAALSVHMGMGSFWNTFPPADLAGNLAIAFGTAARDLAGFELDIP